MGYLLDALEEIARRNAGRPTLTVWKDGSFVVQGALNAEYETRKDEEVLLNLDIETLEPITFPDLQARTHLHEKVLPLNRKRA
jgi:hypothetical protein